MHYILNQCYSSFCHHMTFCITSVHIPQIFEFSDQTHSGTTVFTKSLYFGSCFVMYMIFISIYLFSCHIHTVFPRLQSLFAVFLPFCISTITARSFAKHMALNGFQMVLTPWLHLLFSLFTVSCMCILICIGKEEPPYLVPLPVILLWTSCPYLSW